MNASEVEEHTRKLLSDFFVSLSRQRSICQDSFLLSDRIFSVAILSNFLRGGKEK